MNQPSNQPAGLTSGQARERQEQFGKNELLQEKKQSVFRVLIAALGEPMFILLMAAAGSSTGQAAGRAGRHPSLPTGHVSPAA